MDLLKLRKPLMSLYKDGYVLGAGYGMENPNTVGIDVSGDFKPVLNRLAKLKTTDYIEYEGEYLNCPGYHMVEVKTSKTLEELEDWLYGISGDFDYGVFEVD